MTFQSQPTTVNSLFDPLAKQIITKNTVMLQQLCTVFLMRNKINSVLFQSFRKTSGKQFVASGSCSKAK